MDQALVAGIGNIYADELLFQARLHPKTRAGVLDEQQREALLDTIKEVLQGAIDCGAGAEQLTDRLPGYFLTPQRRSGGVCPRCHRTLDVVKVGGRTTYYCQHCQPEPA